MDLAPAGESRILTKFSAVVRGGGRSLNERGSHSEMRFTGAIAPLFAMLAIVAPASHAQNAPLVIDPITVTATRHAERAFDVPASVDILDADAIQNGQPMVNLSESLSRIPGVFVANRQNYAQDLQISSRGFGARATFGERGVRIYQDGIPVTMPDGQAQTGSFSLLSAARIEILRGPFSALYGNASGGVISIFTEDPPDVPYVEFNAGGGSYGTGVLGVKLGTRGQYVGGVVAASEFVTDGYRDHSSARRDLTNAKVVIDPSSDTRITLIGNTQFQPETQDPLGLTRAEWSANPRGADPAASLFDTRKTINQEQVGASLDHRFSDAFSLHVDGYGGRRLIRQYLALTGTGATSSGGVPDLDRDYGGIGVRLDWRGAALDRPLTVSVGGDFNHQHERRKGFVNNFGALGDLRRDEDDNVYGNDLYAQAQWAFAPRFTGTLGVRTSNVHYTSQDHYVTEQNPDDSGSRRFDDTSPVGGIVYHVSDDLNAYASYGEGFETPTFAELAYRQGGSGLNFGLQPARSRATELGLKFRLAERQRLTAAIFNVDTRNEIVVDTAIGGRTIYKTASATRRRGAEAAWDGRFDHGIEAHAALTWLRAEFTEPFSTGSSPIPVASGARIPAVPSKQAYGELAWVPERFRGLDTALEFQYVDKLYVNEANTDAAPSYAVMNWRVGFGQTYGAATWKAFVRVNNLFDRNYSGSVIVDDGNGRFFEPAPGRNWFVGANVDVKL
jgi:iron complex outermembrane receptor protein